MEKQNKHILVIRLSAPGDVAMLIPVLHSFQQAFPTVKISVVTNARLAALFEGLQVNLIFADTQKKHKGILGLYKLFREIRKQNQSFPIDAVADMHGVVRSFVLRHLFALYGVRTAVIDKGRKEKKQLVRKENKVLRPLLSSFTRYKKVFQNLDLDFPFSFVSIYKDQPALPDEIKKIVGEKKLTWIGIAPFAAHPYKTYPAEKMKQVAEYLYKENYQLFFFGGKNEAALLHEWQQQMPEAVNIAGKLNLADELKLMSWLNCMISMDSANMHFASLVNVPVVSVWGATHPYAGFLGWNQQLTNVIQTELGCRPCSVFGNRACWRKDFACMQKIAPDDIVEKVVRLFV